MVFHHTLKSLHSIIVILTIVNTSPGTHQCVHTKFKACSILDDRREERRRPTTMVLVPMIFPSFCHSLRPHSSQRTSFSCSEEPCRYIGLPRLLHSLVTIFTLKPVLCSVNLFRRRKRRQKMLPQKFQHSTTWQQPMTIFIAKNLM